MPATPDSATAPETVEQALSHASDHARNAVAESLLATRSLLDAVAIALSGAAVTESDAGLPGARGALASLASTIDQLARSVRAPDAALPRPLSEALVGALDAEIERWETRSERDAEARAVLRAFLGLREILWELGVRRAAGPAPGEAKQHGDAAETPDAASSPTRDGASPARPARVQRIRVDG